MAQQNEQVANFLKKNSYRNTFESYMNNFLPVFSIDDVKKYDLFTKKILSTYFTDLMSMLRHTVAIGEKLSIPLK